MKRTINRCKMQQLMSSHCGNNYNKFGRELGIDPAHLYRFLTTGVGGGKKMVFALMDFCDKRNLNYKNYFES